MWQVTGAKRGNLLLHMKNENTNIESLIQPKKGSELFTKDIRKAQFYYQYLLTPSQG